MTLWWSLPVEPHNRSTDIPQHMNLLHNGSKSASAPLNSAVYRSCDAECNQGRTQLRDVYTCEQSLKYTWPVHKTTSTMTPGHSFKMMQRPFASRPHTPDPRWCRDGNSGHDGRTSSTNLLHMVRRQESCRTSCTDTRPRVELQTYQRRRGTHEAQGVMVTKQCRRIDPIVVPGHLLDPGNSAPMHNISVKVQSLDGRIEYMGGCVMIGRLTSSVLTLGDEWKEPKLSGSGSPSKR